MTTTSPQICGGPAVIRTPVLDPTVTSADSNAIPVSHMATADTQQMSGRVHRGPQHLINNRAGVPASALMYNIVAEHHHSVALS